MGKLTLLDPTGGEIPAHGSLAPKLFSLRGKVAVLLDISKPKGQDFLDRIEEILRDQHGVADVIRARKPTFTKPAPLELREDLARRASFVIEALAD